MKSLLETQRAFLAGVLGGDIPGDARARAYRRNVLGNLHDALAATYPVVRRLVGDGFFREAAERYALAHPSRSGDLHRYGAQLGDFLDTDPHARELPYLADVARLEWACAESFHAADGAGFDFAALAAVDEDARENVRLVLHPAVRLMRSRHPVAAIWNANQPGRDGTPERVEGADCVLVHREDFTVRVSRLREEDWNLLCAIASAMTLGRIAEDPVAAARLEAGLVEWTARGVIDGFIACPPGR